MDDQFVVFRLGLGEYAIDIMGVKEIIRCKKTVKLPDTPAYMKGVISYRKSTVPVIDLNIMLELPESHINDATRIIIINTREKQIGFMVDQVLEVLKIPEKDIENAAGTAADVKTSYIKGIGRINDRLIILLELAKMLSTAVKGPSKQAC